MLLEEIQIPEFRCRRCGHKWFPNRRVMPRVCPRCKSPYWNIPKKRKKQPTATKKARTNKKQATEKKP
jgi:uncharacterized OB-fold protein